jgi:predicted dehydrogenase
VKGRLGVGFLGAGMATQAIHLPALATVADRFRVVHVMDPELEVAAAVASRLDARASATVDEVLGDPAVDVVTVCSPDRFHADHVIAACEARKGAVLCEKPLAVTREEVRRIRAASLETGVPVVVGTMHAYDPAFRAAREAWLALDDPATLVRSVIYLPSVGDQVAWATEHIASSYISFEPHEDALPADQLRRLMRTVVLDLAIHNTPLVRELVPDVDKVRFARVRLPFGYVLSLSDGRRLVQLLALMWGRWPPDWTFEAWGANHALHIAFPPSYVLSGSATAELASPQGRTSWRFPRNGYQLEWEHVADVVAGSATSVAPDEWVADLEYALRIADGAERQLAGAT